jgi:hypothetical protein
MKMAEFDNLNESLLIQTVCTEIMMRLKVNNVNAKLSLYTMEAHA